MAVSGGSTVYNSGYVPQSKSTLKCATRTTGNGLWESLLACVASTLLRRQLLLSRLHWPGGIVTSARIKAELRIPAENGEETLCSWRDSHVSAYCVSPAENWGRDKPHSREDQFLQLRRLKSYLKCLTQVAISTDWSEYCSNGLYFLFMSGGVEPGDQLLNVEGISLLGINVQQAHEELNKAMSRSSVGCVLPISWDKPLYPVRLLWHRKIWTERVAILVIAITSKATENLRYSCCNRPFSIY